MPPGFGTSGLRGRVSDLTPELVGSYVTAFVQSCPVGSGLFVARDLRPSSERIVDVVSAAARGCGVAVTDCGALPTPALAMAAGAAGAAAIMVTGSHIPADRNGLKFFTPGGEIGKGDEAAILAARQQSPPPPRAPAMLCQADPGPDYVARYAQAFGSSALSGRRIGVWAQSAVGRDLLAAVLSALGAELVEIDRRDHFLALDTEAIDPDTRRFLALSCAMHGVESIVSTDGDGDRPLVTDAEGRVIPGDLLGQITARYLGARVVVTPLTSNSGVTQSGFDQVIRTRVGAPHVIAAMQAVQSERPGAAVVGYEANGGFLLGFAARGPAGPLPMLMTRDSLLPIVAALVMAGAGGLAALRDSLPDRATASDRLPRIDRRIARQVLTGLMQDAQARAAFLASVSERAQHCDLSDGLRMGLQSGRILHLRLSGNAPELRCYAEAESVAAASALLRAGLEAISRLLAQTD